MKEQTQSITVKNNGSTTSWGDSYTLGTNTITTTDYTSINTDFTTDSFSFPKEGVTLTFNADEATCFDFYKYFIEPDVFTKVIEYVPNKVYKFIFNDKTEIKTICDESDTFDLEYAFFLALAKKLYSNKLTFDGVIAKVQELQYSKYYCKLVKKGIKLFFKQKEEENKKQLEKEQKERQHKRLIEKKKRRDARRAEQAKENLIDTIQQAIARSK